MKKHNGMRPHDVAVLIYIALYCDGQFKLQDLSNALYISLSEVSESIKRSRIAKLISSSKKIYRSAVYDFIIYGLKYVYPVVPGGIVRGVPTAHTARPLCEMIVGQNEHYVWQSIEGDARGMSIAPLYPNLAKVALNKSEFGEFFALIDALRIGRVREKEIAVVELKKRLGLSENT